jgi:hypothetical protein
VSILLLKRLSSSSAFHSVGSHDHCLIQIKRAYSDPFFQSLGLVCRKKQELSAFLKRINITFSKEELLLEAITHKSYNPKFNFEKVSFLGRTALDKVILSWTMSCS